MAGVEPENAELVEMSAVDIQQEYFEAMGDADWELYEVKDRQRMLQKIAIALCGPPTEEGDLFEDQSEQKNFKLQGYDPRSEDITMKVFNKICEQEKYSHNGETILLSIIRVVCVAPAKDVPFYKRDPDDYWLDLHMKKGKDVIISIFHVFSLRKCISMCPGVVGIGAMVGVLGLMAAPVVAPLALGTVVAVGAATSVYGIVRSSIHLADRGNHEQTIGLMSSEARASWLNILVSSAGLSFSAVGKLVAWAASSGTNIKILINAVQFLKYTTIASGLLGVVNGFGEMIHKYTRYNEKPTKLELFQFTSSLLFFGIGVMSNQTAQEIVEDAQAKSINNIRETLTSKAKRKMFDKMTAETRRLKGSIQGNADVIKGLKTITNKNEFFAKLSKMNKQLNENKLRISLSSDGTPWINNQYQMTLTKLSGLGRAGRDKLFATFEPARVTTKNVPTRLYALSAATSQMAPVRIDNISYIRPEEIIKIAYFLKTLCQADKEFICDILSEITADIHQAFMLVCIEMLDCLIPAEIDFCMSFLGHQWKVRLMYFVYDFFISKVEFEEDSNLSLNNIFKEFVVNGRVNAETIKNLKCMIITWMAEKRSTISGTSSDPRKFDGMFEFRKKSQKKYETLQAGRVVQIGNHDVIIKEGTIEWLDEHLLASYSQENCDLFIELCFRVISTMSPEEVQKVNLVNLDEDILIRVSKFIIDWNDVEQLLSIVKNNGQGDTVALIKVTVIDWAAVEKVRNHETCPKCKGIRYCD